MKAESLEELGTAFRKWRAMKRHLREEMPKELVERARRTARVHGVQEVARAVKVDGRRLEGTMGVWRAKQGARAAPGYSRVEMVASAGAGAFAELEMPNGVKVTFATDVLTCDKCGGPRRVVACVFSSTVAREILEHLRLPSRPLPRAPARGPPQYEMYA